MNNSNSTVGLWLLFLVRKWIWLHSAHYCSCGNFVSHLLLIIFLLLLLLCAGSLPLHRSVSGTNVQSFCWNSPAVRCVCVRLHTNTKLWHKSSSILHLYPMLLIIILALNCYILVLVTKAALRWIWLKLDANEIRALCMSEKCENFICTAQSTRILQSEWNKARRLYNTEKN